MKKNKRKVDAVVKFEVDKTGSGKWLSSWRNEILGGKDKYQWQHEKWELRGKEWYKQEVPLESAVS